MPKGWAPSSLISSPASLRCHLPPPSFKTHTFNQSEASMFARSLLISISITSFPFFLAKPYHASSLSSGFAPWKSLSWWPASSCSICSLPASWMHDHFSHQPLFQWAVHSFALLLHWAPWEQGLHPTHLCSQALACHSLSSVCSIKYVEWMSQLKIIYRVVTKSLGNLNASVTPLMKPMSLHKSLEFVTINWISEMSKMYGKIFQGHRW